MQQFYLEIYYKFDKVIGVDCNTCWWLVKLCILSFIYFINYKHLFIHCVIVSIAMWRENCKDIYFLSVWMCNFSREDGPTGATSRAVPLHIVVILCTKQTPKCWYLPKPLWVRFHTLPLLLPVLGPCAAIFQILWNEECLALPGSWSICHYYVKFLSFKKIYPTL